jgi:hypothetical protein
MLYYFEAQSMGDPFETHFPASFDLTTKIVSTVICVAFAVAVAVTWNALIGCAAVLFLLLAYGFSPRGYLLTGETLIVRRLIGNVRIPLQGLRVARAATADDLAGAIRLWGNGGLFGYYGLYRTTALGKCHWYVTSRRDAVVVATEPRTVVVSPRDVENFVSTVRSSVADFSARELPEVSQTAGHTGRIAVVVILSLVLALVAFAMLWDPGPPEYTLSSTSLAIHDRLYPVTLIPGSVDVPGIRIVDIAVDPVWRPTSRVNGFANLRYRAGWFRVSGGQRVRMYRAAANRLVLLPGAGDQPPVLLEVADPDRFVQAIRQLWLH